MGAVVVLVFDTIASFASLALGFEYSDAAAGSVVIYAGIGYFAYRVGGIGASLKAALLVEVVDATLGWGISWVIGPGAPDQEEMTVVILAFTMLLLFAFAACCGLLGGGAARLIHGPFARKA